jgi:F-type H+-transporting ATPase subunit b
MQIDWFTVIAQLLNFFVLVWLLKRFLYKPVLNAVMQREKKISDQLNEGETKIGQAQRERDEFQKKNQEFDQTRTDLMRKAADEAKAERQKLLEQARNDSDVLRSKLEAGLKEESQRIKDNLKRSIQSEVFAIANKTLLDLASADVEEQIVKVFIHRLTQLRPEEKKELAGALSAHGNMLSVESAFSLPGDQLSQIEKAIGEVTGVRASLDHKIVPELVGGIEINAGDRKLSWNIKDYLESMQLDIAPDGLR